jgi:hypothetical protein
MVLSTMKAATVGKAVWYQARSDRECAHRHDSLQCSDGRSVVCSRAHFDTPPHFVHSSSPAAKCFTLADGKALVSVSMTMSSVGQ